MRDKHGVPLALHCASNAPKLDLQQHCFSTTLNGESIGPQ
jgi:hypothetical protein